MPCPKCGAVILGYEQPGGVFVEAPTCGHLTTTYHLPRPQASVQNVWALINQPPRKDR